MSTLTYITLKVMRALKWERVYSYTSDNKRKHFHVFSAGVEGLSIVHDIIGKRTKISYRVFGRATDSPSQAVRMFNAEHKRRAGTYVPAGTVDVIPYREN